MISEENLQLIDRYIYKAKKEKERKYIKLHILIIIIVCIILFSFFGIAKVNSDSMNPTIKQNQIVLYTKYNHNYQKDDLVIVNYQGKKGIRRIVGISGDCIRIDNSNGQVYINDQENDHYFTTSDPLGVKYPLYVSKKQYFVLNDNREYLSDSRKYGCIDMNEIEGKIISII